MWLVDLKHFFLTMIVRFERDFVFSVSSAKQFKAFRINI